MKMEDGRMLTNGNQKRKIIIAFVFAAVSIAGIMQVSFMSDIRALVSQQMMTGLR